MVSINCRAFGTRFKVYLFLLRDGLFGKATEVNKTLQTYGRYRYITSADMLAYKFTFETRAI